MINSRAIKDLHPTLQRAVPEFLKRCLVAGLKVLLTSTYRDNEWQQMLFDKHNGSTKAQGGHSWHNYKLAFDICENIPGHEYDRAKFFSDCAAIWKDMGGQWGSEVNFSGDTPHFQFTNGLVISDLLSGKKMPNDVKMKWETVVSKPAPTATPVKSTTPTLSPVKYPTLKLGSTGNDVKVLQTTLNAKGFKCGTPDGIFGVITDKTVKSFQTKNKLTSNGVVDDKTWIQLKK